MEKETIEKLKELKQLLDEGILTQEEFDTEKQKLLASSPTVIPKAETLVLETEETPVSIREYDTQNRFESQIKPNRTIHIPLLHRSVVINATSPEAVIKKCNNYITRGKIGIALGILLMGVFVYYCFTAGSWAIFGAVFWALFPALICIITGSITVPSYTELRDKFVGMNQAEFNYVQEIIRQKRENEKEAIINIAGEVAHVANTAADVYQEQTGNNMWFDIGRHLGSKY